MIRKFKGVDDYMFELEGFFEAPKAKLLEKFKKSDLEKFDRTENHKSYLKMYVTELRPIGLRIENLA